MSATTSRRVLVLGSGGREHALAWSLAKSSRVARVAVGPGNAGTRDRVAVSVTDPAAVVALCKAEQFDLVVIGPESAVEAGVADALQSAGIDVFGPTRAAGALEWSKARCREFADAHGLPSPIAARFEDAAAANLWANEQSFEVVVKADGLAAGKGVVVPSSATERDAAINDLLKLGPIVLEERLYGEEVSVLAFVDGRNVAVMPPAQDHKRIGEGDTGPNTGGMGAYAPAPVCPPALADEITKTIIQPTVDALAASGVHFVGVLFAGIMLTVDGPKLLEYNCRFGDPECQTLLPLLETDLLDVIEACIAGDLASTDVRWSDAASCAVFAAAPGYPAAPEIGAPITGLDLVATDSTLLFHAGTAEGPSDLSGPVTSGGRVLCASATGLDLEQARTRAYESLDHVVFPGKQVRRDIGWRALARTSGGYAASGVDIDAGNEAVERLAASVTRTHTPAVLAGVGAFGGAIDVSALKNYDQPVLVASTDGVGTKVMVASASGSVRSVGIDIVNHCVNDVLVQRAEPLFFLDYIASSRLIPTQVAEIVDGMAEACSASGCVLLGGETAEMPGVYASGHFDVAGTLVGLVEKARMLPRTDIAAGDVLIGLASSGPHTSGYSLLRRIFRGIPLESSPAPLTTTLYEALLEPHRSYLPPLKQLLTADLVKALIHITGGGLQENIPRVLPPGTAVEIDLGSWPVPPLFQLIRDVSGLDAHELHRTLNMGIGMIVVAAPTDVEAVQTAIDEPTWIIGRVTTGDRAVTLR